MRRLFVCHSMVLDGFFETEKRELNFFVVDEDFLAYARDLLRSVDAVLFGRLTYEHMTALHWPMAPKDEIADQMNSLHKSVFSKTLAKAEWNNSRVVNGDREEVAKLKRHPGKDMVVLGSASIASPLREAGLVDDYRVILNPVLLGRGKPLFSGVQRRISLKLLGKKLFVSGLVLLSYRKARTTNSTRNA